MLRSAFLYSAEIIAGLMLVLVLLRVRVPRWLLWGVVGYGILATVILAVADTAARDPESTDLIYFWSAGRAIWQGGDPYRDPYVLNPPTAGPLYVLFGTVSLPTLAVIWMALNTVGGLLLVPLAYRTLKAVDAQGDWNLPPVAVGLVTVLVSLSFAFRFGAQAGQLSCLITLALLAALFAWVTGRRVLAGVCLAVATIKTGMMLPFLLLFHRRSDWRVWAAMIVASAALCLSATPAAQLLPHCRECLKNISAFSAHGMENDYSYDNVSDKGMARYVEIIGVDHLLYRAGLRDRALIQAANYAFLLLLGAWTAWQVMRRTDLPRGAALSLVALYSAVFLYHRLQDMIVLCLPLTYVLGRVLVERGRTRLAYALCATATVGILNLRTGLLESLTLRYANSASIGGRFIEAFVLPYGTWLVLLAMACLAAAESFRRRQEEPTARLSSTALPANADPFPRLHAVREPLL